MCFFFFISLSLMFLDNFLRWIFFNWLILVLNFHLLYLFLLLFLLLLSFLFLLLFLFLFLVLFLLIFLLLFLLIFLLFLSHNNFLWFFLRKRFNFFLLNLRLFLNLNYFFGFLFFLRFFFDLLFRLLNNLLIVLLNNLNNLNWLLFLLLRIISWNLYLHWFFSRRFRLRRDNWLSKFLHLLIYVSDIQISWWVWIRLQLLSLSYLISCLHQSF